MTILLKYLKRGSKLNLKHRPPITKCRISKFGVLRTENKLTIGNRTFPGGK